MVQFLGAGSLTLAQAAVAADPPAVTQLQRMTLWGVTIGDKLALPACQTGKYDAVTEPHGEEPPCFHGGFIYNLLHDNQSHDYHATAVHLDKDKDVVEQLMISTILDEDCASFAELLTKKLGKPKHNSATMQNGFGATWQWEVYSWSTADGSEAALSIHGSDREGCFLTARSAEKAAKDKPKSIPEP